MAWRNSNPFYQPEKFGHQSSVPPWPFLGWWFQHVSTCFNHFKRSGYETSINGSCTAPPEHLQEWKELLLSISGWRWMAAADLSNVRNWMSAVSKRRSQWRWNTWRNDQGSDGHGMYGQSYHQNLDDSIASMTVLCWGNNILQACWKLLNQTGCPSCVVDLQQPWCQHI